MFMKSIIIISSNLGSCNLGSWFITLLFAASLPFCTPCLAQKPPVEYKFTVEKEAPYTKVKNQAASGTCWSFSGIGFLESEILRKGGRDTMLFSEMWVVRHIYKEKIEKYVRMHGKIELAGGGSFFDVLHACKTYGMVPETVYSGLLPGSNSHNHNELDRVMASFGKTLVEGKKLSNGWRKAADGILDAYLGELPTEFTQNGIKYTPESYMEATGLNVSDYVSITSFTHHPFYSSFILEIPDNWIYESSYNLPIDEMMSVIDSALNKGFSVAWGSDVSEKSFSRDVATIPEEKITEQVGTDQAKWTGKPAQNVVELLPSEKTISQEMRQEAFDNYETTDDHGMLMVGLAKDQNGKKFYKVKNSWGIGGKYKGFLFVSQSFVRYKTINIVLHKDAVPDEIRKKLGF
ncbi:MAG: aminopeptidase [Prevotellaceae bacterium]|nr:aminopeptidase [Prevotellaceae bacterium]